MKVHTVVTLIAFCVTVASISIKRDGMPISVDNKYSGNLYGGNGGIVRRVTDTNTFSARQYNPGGGTGSRNIGNGGMGASPFSSMSDVGGSVSTSNTGQGPFSVGSVNGNKNSFSVASMTGNSKGNSNGAMSGGQGISLPFSSAINSGRGGGIGSGSPFASASSSVGGKGSPFSSTMGNSAGSGSGNGPFSNTLGIGDVNSGGSGSGPFSANIGSGSGLDISSLISSGPGGLLGGDFMAGTNTNTSLLMGNDYSQAMNSNGYGDIAAQSTGQAQSGSYNIDSSRFDTSSYENMLNDMFNSASVRQELTELGNPFDGSSYTSPTNKHGDDTGHYDTSAEPSLGAYASTDMSAYTGNSGQVGGNTRKPAVANGYSDSSSGYGGGSSNSATGEYGNPFNINNYDSSQLSAGSGSRSHIVDSGNAQSPFDTIKFSDVKNPFNANNNMNSAESTGMSSAFSGNSPFSIKNNGAGSGASTGMSGGRTAGQNPFNTSKFSSVGGTNGQSPFSVDKMSGNSQSPFGAMSGGSMSGQAYQSNTGGDGGNTMNTNGLDKYGNVDFEKLPGISGNNVDKGSTGMGYSMHTSTYNGGTSGTYTASSRTYSVGMTSGSGSAYSGSQDGLGTGQYGTYHGMSVDSTYGGGVGTNYGTVSGSSGQYQTPFESDNYNELLGNPFKSQSYFDANKQNFKLPYETDISSLKSGNSGSKYGNSFGDGGHFRVGTGPGGDPFNQGGHNTGNNNVMRI